MREHLDKQFNRVFISTKDMEKSSLYFSAAEKAYAAEEQDAAAGLIAAGIVAYARPFSGNEPHERAASNPPSPIPTLSLAERALHERLIRLRNTVIAHSDAEMNPAATVEYRSTGFLVSSRIYNPISEAYEIQKFIALSKKCQGFFQDKMFELSRRVNQLD